ncbi:DUF5995 family protein [Pseudofulvibacter geojedonensis]|uniref:DUF5995 family protein n=1 Tax=Pseudofulvibacter geojedonensis TaxID=1123758 RepID=A0ABW3I0X6_9FLAO
MQANNIDEVLSILENIIDESKQNNDTLGYFAALYKKVTRKVKEGIDQNYFDNNERMELLDVVFANRYIKAYYDYKERRDITNSWSQAFLLSKDYWPIVLQHLLIGMNAHINLDLGIATAEVSKNQDIEDLHDDFNKINQILSSLVKEVEEELSAIWPTLKKILKYTKKVDNFFVDFSMELARDGAWNFAKQLHNTKPVDLQNTINTRDEKIAQKATIISKPGFVVSLLFSLIRLGEKGSITEKITVLNSPN